MKRMMQIILFVLASIIEVEVRASDNISLPAVKEPLQFPEGCLQSTSDCILRTVGKVRFALKIEKGEITMLESAAIERSEELSWQILDGTVVVSTQQPVKLKLKFADLEVRGAAIVTQGRSEALLQAISGDIKYRPLGHKRELTLDQGFEVRLSGVKTDGLAQVSFPKAWDFKETIRRLAQSHDGTFEQFQSRWEGLGVVWRSAVRNSSVLHQDLYERTLASVQREANEEQQRREQAKREKEFYRDLIWKRQFPDP